MHISSWLSRVVNLHNLWIYFANAKNKPNSSRFTDVLGYCQSGHNYEKSIHEGSPILHCEILHAVNAETAVKLSDVVFRRTDLGTASCPSLKQLKAITKIMAYKLGWNESKQTEEIDEVLG